MHPTDGAGSHELYFMCADIAAFVEAATAKGAGCSEVQDRGWGRLVTVTLPSGGTIGVYEPRHARP